MRFAQEVGAAGVIVAGKDITTILEIIQHFQFPVCLCSADNLDYNATNTTMPFSMSGDKVNDVEIPSVFMQKDDAMWLRELMGKGESVMVLLTWLPSDQGQEGNAEGTQAEQDRKEGLEVESLFYDSEDKPDKPDKLVRRNGEGDFQAGSGSPDEDHCHDQDCERKEVPSDSRLYDNGHSSGHESL